MIFDLPTSLEFGGKAWRIRTDYRNIITILLAFDDDDLTPQEKAYVCLYDLYEDFEDIPQDCIQAAYDQAIWFIDRGEEADSEHGPRTMDWEQDAAILFPAVNHVAGYEVRSVEYLHWWTFMGFFMEIRDSVYSTVLQLRQKKARGKKLEKYEREFWAQNKKICTIRPKQTEDDKAEMERLKAMLGG